MIDLLEIEEEINKLEQSETTFQNCSKLADLYTVRDHLSKDSGYSYGQSEFLQACSQVPIEKALSVIDEHMDAIQILHPKEYRAVIKMIKEV